MSECEGGKFAASGKKECNTTDRYVPPRRLCVKQPKDLHKHAHLI